MVRYYFTETGYNQDANDIVQQATCSALDAVVHVALLWPTNDAKD